ncbi:hypothetical protein [Kocuria palustris]|uniref:hypothetical protein n=1 Tax=Kocuria palustris TaxID=71999 RepID=UPI0011A144F1|nr:hypothetical protein [Kocuria palustris]
MLEAPAAAGVLESPLNGRARAAVLVVGPLGRERVVSTAAIAVLSRELAEEGCLVLRLSLRGSGDSHDLDGDDVRSAWRADVRAAVSELRRRAPGLAVHAVGLRLGAAVLVDACTAAETAGDGTEAAAGPDAQPLAGLDWVELWEPLGGRAQLRRDQALRRVSVPRPTEAEGTEVSGMLWSRGQAECLRTLPDPRRSPLPSAQWSLREEEDREAAEMLWGVGSEFARVPRAAIHEIVERLTAAAALEPPLGPETQRAVDMEPRAAAALTVPDSSGAPRRVIETFVRVADGRPAVLSAAEDHCAGADGRPLPATAVQFIAAASEPSDGPTGLWTSAARDLAADGMTVLRAERPGCGILSDPRLDTIPSPYDPATLRAVASDADWLKRRTGLPVTAVGLCVGSWLALRSAKRDVTRRVIAVNNVAWRPGTGYYDLLYAERDSWENAPRGFTKSLAREAGGPERRPSWSVRVRDALRPRLRGLRGVVETHAPAPARHLLALLGISDAVSSMLVLPGGAREIDLILGAEDLAEFREARGQWGVRLARRLGHAVRVHDVPSLDHALLAASGRAEVRTMLRDMLASSGGDGDRAAPTASGDTEGAS